MERFALGTAGDGTADVQSQTSFGYSASRSAAKPITEPVTLTPDQINALIGAAADPEAMVRARAVTALLATGQRERIITPLVARLVDSARVVRARAAEALLALGISQLPDKAGEALARAQDEYATALADFPDVPANHAALGWLAAERNRIPDANAALENAIKLDPRSARPWVIKGLIAARASRFDEATELWRKAKALDPTYPNIDRLIEEAEKRRVGIRD
jgi:tetratricopeptide (TPR) repeat protein